MNHVHTDPQYDSTVHPAWLFLLYTVLLLIAVALFALICHWGAGLAALDADTSSSPGEVTVAHEPHMMFHVLITLVAVIVTGRLLGRALRWINQPAVIGEVVAGILLGPSLLGWLWPAAAEFVLPDAVAPSLGVIAQLAIILYMFLVGLEFDGAMLRKKGHAATIISHMSIVFPFLLGGVLALWLYPSLAPAGVSFESFALFFGISMSITAFPVLARILTDRGLLKTPLGAMAFTCAAADDVTAWCLLAFVVSVVQAQTFSVLWIVVAPLAYLLIMFLLIRPIVVRLARSKAASELNQGVLAAVFVALLLSALTTEWLGIHAIFGAFVLGALVPHDSVIARQLPAKIQNVVVVLLLPAFFALTGMRTEIGLVSGLHAWMVCGAIIMMAVLGKFGGTFAAARFAGIGWRESAALGSMMNTRGLMELVVLNIGLDLGVISPTLFAMLVIMALVTTFMTSPALSLFLPELRRSATA